MGWAERLINRFSKGVPDFVVGDEDEPYLLRWFVLPRNRFFNIYLHLFLNNEPHDVLHDHPWFWASYVLRGQYMERTIAAGGVHRRKLRNRGSLQLGSPWRAHSIELWPAWLAQDDFTTAMEMSVQCPNRRAPAWTLFITGPVLRDWGFHCPRGWKHWKVFTQPWGQDGKQKGCRE